MNWKIFSCLLAIFISFCELLISFAQFSIRFLDIFLSILKESFLLEILPFIPDKCYEYIPQMSLSFNFTYDDFFLYKSFRYIFMESSWSPLTFIVFPFRIIATSLSYPQVKENSPLFAYSVYMPLRFLIRPLVPLDLIVAYGGRCGSNFIFCQMVT